MIALPAEDRRSASLDLPLLSVPMAAVLVAQFLSALADNALLIAAIAVIKQQGAERLVPALQQCFVVPFILLAPFVGAFADAWPKGRVMFVANGVKLLGAALMFAGLSPLAAYALVGIGATAYSPAKYGILTQLFGPERLVRANGMLEGSTIAAILLGVLIGGWLADTSLTTAFVGILCCYGAAAAANLVIPRLPPEHPVARWQPVQLLKDFLAAVRILYTNRDARFSLLGTAVFWGSGTTLRLLLFAWVPVALAITDNQTPANLMGVVSVGIVLGAATAGFWIRLETVNRALVGGLLLGPLVAGLAHVSQLGPAMAFLGAIGFSGGLFVVPLNALLQERGHGSIGAGRALAVQNFSENIVMLLFVSLYSLSTKAGTPATNAAFVFGIGLLACIGVIAALRLRSPRVAASS